MTNSESKDAATLDWQGIPSNIGHAIKNGWRNGVPPLASALYGRWWQLESWLRTLLYVELRANLGSSWPTALPQQSEKRQQGDDEFRYMATADAQDILAYADASKLFDMTLDNWELFQKALLPKNIWAGRIEELLAIRNRIGHCRRPHSDDLIRVEQTLRDLEKGAFATISTFNTHMSPNEVWSDAVTEGWVQQKHQDAARLINHAQRQYGTIFRVRYSCRPWIKNFNEKNTISGKPGYIWHATWFVKGGKSFQLDKFWEDIQPYQNLILFICADDPSSLSISFSALEDPKKIADAIGKCFDYALYNITLDCDKEYDMWPSKYSNLDSRIHLVTPWAVVDESMKGISIFDA